MLSTSQVESPRGKTAATSKIHSSSKKVLGDSSGNARVNQPSAMQTVEVPKKASIGKISRKENSRDTSTATAPSSKSKATGVINGEPPESNNESKVTTLKLKARFVNIGSLSSDQDRNVIDKRSLLNTSFMQSKGKKLAGISNEKVPTIPIFGLRTQVYINVHFGDVKKRSKACELILDTGSNIIWVNKIVYKEALKQNNVRQATSDSARLFKYEYAEGKLSGQLYKDTISFQDKSIFVDQHTFGIVDENTCPIAREWRRDKTINIKGVFGIGPKSMNKNVVFDEKGNLIKNERIPSLIDNLKNQKKVSEEKFGLYFQLPDERESVSTNGTDTMEGELHIGGLNRDAYVEESMREVPVPWGTSYYGINLTLKYNGIKLMNDKSGIIDSGSSLIYLPAGVLDTYIENIVKEDGKPIVKYDNDSRLYRIAKKDIGKLKNLEFDFVMGKDAIFKLSPRAQIFSPNLARKLFPNVVDDFFLVFQKLHTTDIASGVHFVLGLGWMMHHYVVFDSSSSSGKRVWIAKKKAMRIARE